MKAYDRELIPIDSNFDDLTFEIVEDDGTAREVTVNCRGHLKFAGLEQELRDLPQVIGYIGRLHAEAKANIERVDKARRQFRAREAQKILKGNPKAAEWRVKADIEASAKWGSLKEELARAVRDEATLYSLYFSLQKKADLLQSLSANTRTEAERGLNPERHDREPDPEPAPAKGPSRKAAKAKADKAKAKADKAPAAPEDKPAPPPRKAPARKPAKAKGKSDKPAKAPARKAPARRKK